MQTTETNAKERLLASAKEDPCTGLPQCFSAENLYEGRSGKTYNDFE